MMTGGTRKRPEKDTPPGIPMPVTVIVVLVLTALLAYNIVVVGPEGLPNSYVIGGLLGAYAGVDQLVKRRNSGGTDPDESP